MHLLNLKNKRLRWWIKASLIRLTKKRLRKCITIFLLTFRMGLKSQKSLITRTNKLWHQCHQLQINYKMAVWGKMSIIIHQGQWLQVQTLRLLSTTIISTFTVPRVRYLGTLIKQPPMMHLCTNNNNHNLLTLAITNSISILHFLITLPDSKLTRTTNKTRVSNQTPRTAMHLIERVW